MSEIKSGFSPLAIDYNQCRILWCAVVSAALDEAIEDQKFKRDGIGSIQRWVDSSDGRQVLACAGIEWHPGLAEKFGDFVRAGQPTSKFSKPKVVSRNGPRRFGVAV